MIRYLFFAAAAVAATYASARTETVKSPNGQIQVTVNDDNGQAAYSVALGGVEFLQASPLGVRLDCADYASGLSLAAVKTAALKESYSVPTIKQRKVDYEATQSVMTFQKDGKDALMVEWRVSDRDVAFRYTLCQPKKDHFAAVVKEELTGFVVAEGTTTFLCPQSAPMGGFAGTSPSYETHYACDAPTGTNGWGEGFTFPCLFKVNAAQSAQNPAGWMLISETGLTGSYCGCRLLNVEGNHYKIGFPQEREMNGNGSVAPGVSLPYSTPWRTITLGTTLAPIMETTVAWDVVEEQYPASKPFVYGRGTWSWIIGMDGSCNYDEQKRYIDFAASMGYESVLIDALWDTQIGYEKMEQLVRYAASKNVGVYLWYNSNGYWNHAPQGPRGKMHRAIDRKKEMQWLRKAGVRGLKIDFFGGDKQQMVQIYEDILSDANDYGLNVIFHGCTLPRGWERMYPNFVASEAVRASENLHFGQGECDNEAFCATIHPFCRNTVASMDFGGSTLNKHYNADNRHGSARRTSDVFALATAVMLQTPVNHFAMSPRGNDEAPEWAVEFMKQVPTLWDEVRYIDGYPGRYAVLARKSVEGKWYIVGVNAQEQPLNLTLNLQDFGYTDTCCMYSDDAQLAGSVKQVKINKKKGVRVTIPMNGGLVIM